MSHFLKLQPPPAEQRLTCDIVPPGGHYSYYRVLKPQNPRELFISLLYIYILFIYLFLSKWKESDSSVPAVLLSARGPGRLQEEPVSDEGGS